MELDWIWMDIVHASWIWIWIERSWIGLDRIVKKKMIHEDLYVTPIRLDTSFVNYPPFAHLVGSKIQSIFKNSIVKTWLDSHHWVH